MSGRPSPAAFAIVLALFGLGGCISPPTRNPETADGRKITVRVAQPGKETAVTIFYADGRFTHDGHKGRLSRSIAERLMREADDAQRATLSRGTLTRACGGGRRSVTYRIHRMPAGWDTQGWNGGPVDLVVSECTDALHDGAAFFQALAAAETEIAAQLGETISLTPEPRWRERPPRVTVAE